MLRSNQVRSSSLVGLGASSRHGNRVGCKRQRAQNTECAKFYPHIRRFRQPENTKQFSSSQCLPASCHTPPVLEHTQKSVHAFTE